jgi:hypothetical protein
MAHQGQSNGRATRESLQIIPQWPLEDNEMPILEACVTQQEVLILAPNSSKPYPKVVDLIAAENPSRAYIEIPTKDKKNLDHHAPGWGCVYFCIMIPALGPGVFQEPEPGAVQFVAIKKLNIDVVNRALAEGKKVILAICLQALCRMLTSPPRRYRKIHTKSFGTNERVLRPCKICRSMSGGSVSPAVSLSLTLCSVYLL